MNARILAPWLAGTVGAAVLLFSRLHYAPKYLFFFDNANFALALESFNPALHQPQPPGYPVFVALLSAINVWAQDAHRSLICAGLLGSAAALVLLWLWTRQAFGPVAAYVACALLLLHPVFWIAGVANPVRVFLAVIVSAVALSTWQVLTSEHPARWFYISALVLGIVAGFRPETLLLLLPVWLASGIFRKLPIRSVLLGAILLACAAATWILPMAVRMGGIGPMIHAFSDYLRSNSAEHTVTYGAPANRALATARKAWIWNFGMAVVWAWILPFVWRRFRNSWNVGNTLLVLGALLPPLIFHSLVHVRDVDQTLVSIPLICVVGGIAIASIPSRKAMVAVTVLAVAASYWSFRWPFYSEMSAASARTIRYVDDWTRSTYEALDQVSSKENIVLVWYDEVVPWRNVSYYYPNLPMLVLSESIFWSGNRKPGPPIEWQDGAIVLPAADQVILGLSYEGANQAEREWPNAHRVGPLIQIQLPPGRTLQVGPTRLIRRP